MMRIVGLALFVLAIPLFFTLMGGPLRQRRWGWFLFGLLPLLTGVVHLDVSIISWAMWPGYVKGMLVTMQDALSLAILFNGRDPGRGRPLLLPFVLFLVGSSVSIFFATQPMPSFFFAWQVARIILTFAAASRIATRPEGVRQVVAGMAVGIAIQAFYSIEQHFTGVTQASGTMGHQNLLGMCSHFALLLSLAGMLAGDRSWVLKLGVAGALACSVLGGSRATIALAGVGVVALVALSLMRRRTPAKGRVAGIVVAAMLVAAPVAMLTLHNRFSQTTLTEGTYDERAAFERAARMIWSDHPMGVGANQYVIVANTGGYSQRAGVVWTPTSRSANVHNLYLLLGAETGYLGLVTFVILLISALLLGARVAWARPRGAIGEYALGATVVLAVVGLQCFYEWIFVIWVTQALFGTTLGLIAGMAKQQRLQAMELRRRRAAPAPEPQLALA